MNIMNENTLTVNGRLVEIAGERNLLEVIRKAGIDLPTFCYRPELSIYGSCRMCLVQIEGRGIVEACAAKPAPGMSVITDTAQLRQMRRINIELLLASHNCDCPSCARNGDCELQRLARQLGVTEVRYRRTPNFAKPDDSSPSLLRDPSKCILCGNCVRVCREVQGVGALDFIGRGSTARVAPAFDRGLGESECVNCGQCAAVCPTGAIVPKSVTSKVWAALHDASKKVVVQVAPAVRVALGEYFGFKSGENVAPKIVAALRLMGFDQIYDTSFSADMTIFEEGTELLERVKKKGVMPMFTSCCPGWVKFLETFYPELRANLSTTRSPQQIFGSIMRKTLPEKMNVEPEDLVTVSIMPCTAKKYEAQLEKFTRDGRPDVDYVLTTIELGTMLESMGIDLSRLEDQPFDVPLGFATGSGVIFGATGGVMEAALRFAVEKISGAPLQKIDFAEVRGLAPRKEAELEVNGVKLRVAVVHGLANARQLIEEIKRGEAEYDFVEVMACPGGCVSGGGQPVSHRFNFRQERAGGLYAADRCSQLRKSQDNFLVEQCYNESFGGGPGSHDAHHAFHTGYQSRSQVFAKRIPVVAAEDKANAVSVCVSLTTDDNDSNGRETLHLLLELLKKAGLDKYVSLDAAFVSRPDKNGVFFATVGEESVECGHSAQEAAVAVFNAVRDKVKRH